MSICVLFFYVTILLKCLITYKWGKKWCFHINIFRLGKTAFEANLPVVLLAVLLAMPYVAWQSGLSTQAGFLFGKYFN